MWQRGARQHTISSPYQFVELDRDDGYYDDRYLETIHEVDSISSRRQSAHIGLPELPFRAVPPMTEIPQPVNVRNPAMSTSATGPMQAHGLRINVHAHEQYTRPVDDVSPLTPQDDQSHGYNQIGEQPISPIEPSRSIRARAPLPERPFQSQIPRKVSRPQPEKVQTKWDDYSGEPTNDARGKPSSVRPGTEPVELQFPNLKERTKQILASMREREAAKNQPRTTGATPVLEEPVDQSQRPPWRGASGRTAIVAPVHDNPSARIEPLQKLRTPQPVQHAPAHMATTVDPLQQPTEEATPQLRNKASEESIKPVVPLKTRNLTPPMTKTSPVQSPARHNPPQSPEQTSQAPPVSIAPPDVREERVESPQYDPEPTTPTTPTQALKALTKVEDTSPSEVQPDYEREVSRFSWTTYTTSLADSPRSYAPDTYGSFSSSPPPPLPALPSAITIKKRPVSSSPMMGTQFYMNPHYVDSRGSVVRKPLPGVKPRISSATSMAMSTSKSLPPTPTVMEAGDKIENLEAQLEALSRRKYNISRIIADLEISLKRNALTYDMWKRKEVEKNIANHRMSLDDIGSEIHELSLQLHRSQRKRDQLAGHEASSLWIKRVTS